ncbi:MAG: LysR family transcriptional regulator [Alicyclobacillus sp.]|nr:LysR family transcriptional regulator [Alicyclobacillus sp.]
MEIRLLRYVLAVYETQSFSRAAEKLHIAQPSLSQQIAKLEQELGFRLFLRGPGPIMPTPDGEYFVHRASKILHLHDDFVLELQERTHGMGQTLSIGTTAITGAHLLPRLLQLFRRQFPSVQLRLTEESTETLTDLASKSLVDLAILPLPIADPRLSVEPLLSEQLWLALPPTVQPWMSSAIQHIISSSTRPATFPSQISSQPRQHSMDRSNHAPVPVSLDAFADAPFIVLKQGFGFRQTLLQLCANHGFQPNIAFETSSIDTAQALVAHGMGVTLVPEMVMSAISPTPLYVRLESQPTRTLVFAYPKDRYLSLAARTFKDMSLVELSKMTRCGGKKLPAPGSTVTCGDRR